MLQFVLCRSPSMSACFREDDSCKKQMTLCHTTTKHESACFMINTKNDNSGRLAEQSSIIKQDIAQFICLRNEVCTSSLAILGSLLALYNQSTLLAQHNCLMDFTVLFNTLPVPHFTKSVVAVNTTEITVESHKCPGNCSCHSF